MTLPECRVDHQFRYHVIRCWVQPPPPAVWALGRLFKPTFWGLTLSTEMLSHGLVISTPGSHSSTWPSSSPLPSATTPEFRVSVLSFYPWCFFSGGLHFALFQSSKELLFSSPFLSKICRESSPFIWAHSLSGCFYCCLIGVVVGQSLGP
jgi:hypothetical protein